MASYALLASESTVQVLSPTLTNDVVYCTILTQPSGVIASMPVPKIAFDSSSARPELTAFANAIEQIMARPEVVAATGEQTIDHNGLLADNVTFTVQYTPPGTTPTSITADVVIRVAELNFEDELIGRTLLEDVLAKIQATYAQLEASASG
jgi:hypothetical protein